MLLAGGDPRRKLDVLMQALDRLDIAVFLTYLVLTLIIGAIVGRRMHTGLDFFLAGRRLPWWAIGFSLVATDIGGTDIMGVGGATYNHGIAAGNFDWIGCVPVMIIAAFVFVPKFYRMKIYTIPEFMERRYNAAVRVALTLCWLLFMACNMGIMLYASGKLLEPLLGLSQSQCIWLTAILVGLYTFTGGLAAVVYTDVLQCVVMIAGCLAVLVMGVIEVGGVGELHRQVKEVRQKKIEHEQQKRVEAGDAPLPSAEVEHLDLVLPVNTRTPFPWTGIFFGLTLILSPAYWIGNQAIIQRSLGAQSEFDAKAAYVWGALLKNLIPLIIAVPGLIAVVKFPDLQDGDQAIPRLVAEIFPSGFRGLFVAAFMAALMSSVDSYLNSATTLFSHDLYKRFLRPDATDRGLLAVGRATTVVLTAWGIVFALNAGRFDNSGVYAIFQTLMAFFQGPALAILLAGMFWRRATGAGAVVGFIVGVAVSVSLYALNQPAVYSALGWEPLFQIQDPYLYFSVWAFLTTMSLLVIVSLLTKPTSLEKLADIFDKSS